MTDREMQELAAKAAGIEVFMWDVGGAAWVSAGKMWNPLTDDGDALRLAVSVGIDINFSEQIGARVAANGMAEKFVDHTTAVAATRRAIVRAAAEIGRAMG